MSAFLDANVLVALFLEDALSAKAETALLQASAPSIVSDFVAAEFASAIARRVRTGELAASTAPATFADFDTWRTMKTTAAFLTGPDIEVAAGWMRRLDLNLRTPDAVNMAVPHRLHATLVTFDTRMATVARTLGLAVADA